MATIRETATAYEPKHTKNIAELEKVPINVDIKEVEYTRDDGTIFKVNEIEVEGEKYRVPTSVIAQLQAQLEADDSLLYFKVNKSGEGLKTQYTVIPIKE